MAKHKRSDTKMGSGRKILRALAAVGIVIGCLGAIAPDANADGPIPNLTPSMARFDFDACGVKIRKVTRMVNSPTWDCTLAENFNGTSLNPALWTVQTTAGSGFGDGGECFMDSPQNVAVSDGTLQLTARRTAPFTCQQPSSQGGPFTSTYTAGSIHTGTKFNQAYGRFEIRAKMPAVEVPGLQFAFWLWPENSLKYGNQWPMSGELDVMEWYSKYPDTAIPTMHYWHPSTYDPNITNYFCNPGLTAWSGKPASKLSDWHTYTLEWTPNSIKFIYDGKLCLQNNNWAPDNGITKPAPFDHPFMLSLTQALGYFNPSGTPEDNANAATASTPLPATATIDYVKVWK